MIIVCGEELLRRRDPFFDDKTFRDDDDSFREEEDPLRDDECLVLLEDFLLFV